MTQTLSSPRAISPRMPLLMPDDFCDLDLVAWRVEPGTLDPQNPLIEGDMPWNAGSVGVHSCIIQDPIDGLWKGYLTCTPPEYGHDEDWTKPWSCRNDGKRRICYFESTDGVNWTWPELSIQRFGEHKKTNILFDLAEGTSQYASVFVHPDNGEWPYEMFVLRENSVEGEAYKGYGYYRYHSKDGKKWEYLSGPMTDPMKGDLCIFRRENGRYVAYYRIALERQENDHVPIYEDCARRSCYRAFSDDGENWVRDEAMVLTADERDHRDTQYQECVPIEVPGGYIGIITMYLPITQTLNLRTALSRDGSHWWFPDRRPSLPNAPMGDYGGGMIWQSQNLIVEGDQLFVYYGGCEGPHRQVTPQTNAPCEQIGLESVIDHGAHFLPFNGALCRASWRFDRMHALVAAAGGPTQGSATTRRRDLGGKSLSVNLVTRPPKKSKKPDFDAGFMEVELLDGKDKPIKGFARDDCQPLRGDHKALGVKWSGGDRAPQGAKKARFHLKRALFYGFDFQS